ncbi:Hypothetical protein R9X50_00181300 [Acrodontium crateriforme]|uniref:F-box domain-containing protein n=1 Tax=Acrodontium crateriforme TaxID=150365 RepID=A0AAQ3M5U4_9PEZI|nr:Hypothetical protein R9X50_00181300 [Acrodontium crateriforme]
MALDQQRNWDLAMAENLEKVNLDAQEKKRNKPAQRDSVLPDISLKSRHEPKPWSSPPIYLPDEILIHIISFIDAQADSAQPTLAVCCLLSHRWYSAAVPFLYARPYLYGANFDPFVRSICPSINLHVRASPLSELVRELNMGRLVHQGSRSLTARLLGRTKGSLEIFVAPQASFAMNCFPALAKCKNLRILDLSLVSESPPLPELFRTVSHLPKLRVFKLPRSSGMGTLQHTPIALPWPPTLEDVTLSGGIDAHFVHGLTTFPHSLRRLTINHCPQVKGSAIMNLLRSAVRPLASLESLSISNMPRLSSYALNDVLSLLPKLTRLSVSVDYITPAMFDIGRYTDFKDGFTASTSIEDTNIDAPRQHRLRTLELTTSGNTGVEDKISPIDVLIALDDQALPCLRQVRVAQALLWHSSATLRDTEALADALQEASKRDWEMREGIFATMSSQEYGIPDIWEKRSGVWEF